MAAFDGAVVLAPMVRVSTLPMRLLALDFGADFVYVEEIIDFKLIDSERVLNPALGTVDFVQKDGTLVFRTCGLEKSKVILQLGTADPDRAVAAAKKVEADVAGIDVNMGCPKDYSTKGGMGCALLKTPDLAESILRALVGALSVPVTCKIRVQPSTKDTVSFARRMESTGISCLAVHGRYREERPRDPNHDEAIRAVSGALRIPVLANGGSGDAVRAPQDVEYFRQLCGASGVMLARAAMWNPSIFRRGHQELESSLSVIRQFLKYAVKYDNPFQLTKYTLQQLMHTIPDSDEYRKVLRCCTVREMCAVFHLEGWCDSELSDRRQQTEKRKICDSANGGASISVEDCLPVSKKRIRVSEDGEVTAAFRYFRRQYLETLTPKAALNHHCRSSKLDPPVYTVRLEGKFYYGSVTVDGVTYRNVMGDQSKKYCEQGVAALCLTHLGIYDGRKPDICPPDS